MGQLTYKIRQPSDVVLVKNAVQKAAKSQGFSLLNTTRIVTATSELCRNMLDFAQRGEVRIQQLSKQGRPAVCLVFADEGPGIADISQAMKEGYSSRNSLGMGLPGTRRIMKEFHIESSPGEGTKIEICHWQ